MRKTVLITGASSGFGREAALLFQQQGWNVAATMRNPGREQHLNTLDNVWVGRLDVCDATSIAACIKEAIEKFGGIDVLINNAGYGLMGVFESSTTEQVQRQYAVNVFGLMEVTRRVLPGMRSRRSGTIINISSFGGQVGLPFGSPYVSSKFAVEGFSESLSHEVSPFGIAVKIVEPGSVATNFRNTHEMIPNGIEEYTPVIQSFFQSYGQVTAHLHKATAQQVAATIYEAATDGLPRLRYVIGDDAQFYIDSKLKNTEEQFIAGIRQSFLSAPGN